jgi:hypothetical protein
MGIKNHQSKIINQKSKIENDVEFAIGKENFKYIAIGVGILVIGFLLMSGGKTSDPNVFNPEIFNFRRITLAPIVVVGGFMFIIWAIMKKPKE